MGLRDRLTGRRETRTLAPLVEHGFAVIDIETTGLVAGRDRVIEIAVVQVDQWGRTGESWTTLINPGGPVGVTRGHGITSEDVLRAPLFADIAGDLVARLAGRVLVAHNARFDLPFLADELDRAGCPIPPAPYLCTLEASWQYLPRLTRRRLLDCCGALGVPLTGSHSALGDATATAGLLAAYLLSGEPAARAHLALLGQATQVPWPRVPAGGRPLVFRRPVSRPVSPVPGRLTELLDDLRLTAPVDHGAPPDSAGYLELLAEFLEDGELTDAALTDLGRVYGLSSDQVVAAHRGLLLALAHKAVADGKVTRAERDELVTLAAELGFPVGIVTTVLDGTDARQVRPLPGGWSHGRPLHIGDSVVFSGCEDRQRARLESRAHAAGLRVSGSVSGRTAVLVTDDPAAESGKGAAARTLGTRIVTPDTFALLLKFLQPA